MTMSAASPTLPIDIVPSQQGRQAAPTPASEGEAAGDEPPPKSPLSPTIPLHLSRSPTAGSAFDHNARQLSHSPRNADVLLKPMSPRAFSPQPPSLSPLIIPRTHSPSPPSDSSPRTRDRKGSGDGTPGGREGGERPGRRLSGSRAAGDSAERLPRKLSSPRVVDTRLPVGLDQFGRQNALEQPVPTGGLAEFARQGQLKLPDGAPPSEGVERSAQIQARGVDEGHLLEGEDDSDERDNLQQRLLEATKNGDWETADAIIKYLRGSDTQLDPVVFPTSAAAMTPPAAPRLRAVSPLVHEVREADMPDRSRSADKPFAKRASAPANVLQDLGHGRKSWMQHSQRTASTGSNDGSHSASPPSQRPSGRSRRWTWSNMKSFIKGVD
jgi:hypothetical protein